MIELRVTGDTTQSVMAQMRAILEAYDTENPKPEMEDTRPKSAEVPPPAAETPVYTLEEVRSVLAAVRDKCGRDKVGQLLQMFGVATVPALPKDKYMDMMLECTKVLNPEVA